MAFQLAGINAVKFSGVGEGNSFVHKSAAADGGELSKLLQNMH